MARSTIAGLAVQPSPPSMLKSMKLGFLEKDERGATHRPRMKQQQQQQSDTPKPKIKSISEKLAKVDDADDDAILDAAIALNNSCWFTKCKEKVSLLGVTCPHCTYRYCMQHSMPEVHGCGDAARTAARSETKARGAHIVAGVLLGQSKGLKPGQRDQLQAKLEKSISKKEEARAAAPSKKK
eukprot:m.636558 g.636558  ORF g.636558 m.636558 type:complete len:182 (+) comp58311_c0_seq4:3790-4335(+)